MNNNTQVASEIAKALLISNTFRNGALIDMTLEAGDLMSPETDKGCLLVINVPGDIKVQLMGQRDGEYYTITEATQIEGQIPLMRVKRIYKGGTIGIFQIVY